MTIGEQIRDARKKAGMKQSDLAEKLGVAVVTIGQYERGQRTPRLEQIRAIANALDVDVYDLIDGGFGALDPVLPPNMQGVNLDGAKIDEDFLAYMISRLSQLDRSTVKYQRALNNILALANSSNLTEKAYELLERQQISFDRPMHKMSEAEVHRAGFLQFKSEEDRIAFFYSLLNIDGKLVASRCFYQHLNKDELSEVADYVEKLSETPQYQRQEPPEGTDTASPESPSEGTGEPPEGSEAPLKSEEIDWGPPRGEEVW